MLRMLRPNAPGRLIVALCFLAGACTSAGSSDDSSSAGEAEPTESTLGGSELGSELEQQLVDRVEAIVPDPDPTPIAMDPLVRVGELDNGLTYYLRSNSAPGGRLELRLAVDAGSAMQESDDAGLAHFVEHMLFNGTTNYPDNTLDLVLQRLGLEIGPDVNAYTTADETVYELTVATDSASVTQAFDVLLDWAGAATMSPDAVVEERGVVREERRVRSEGGEGEMVMLFDELYNQGSDYAGNTPIGSIEGILATTAQDTRRFYDRWYRPELMAVVVVGDMSLDDMEEEVVSRFASLSDRGDGTERAVLEAGPITEASFQTYAHPEVTNPSVSLDFWIPSWDESTVGGERLLFLDSIVGAVLGNWIQSGIEAGNIRAIEAYAGDFSYNRARRFLGMNITGEDMVDTTEDIASALQTVRSTGFTDAEVNQVIDQYHAGVDQYLAGADTRQDRDFASDYVSTFLDGSEASSIQAAHQRVSAMLDDLSAQDINGHYAYLLDNSAPLLVASGPDADELAAAEEFEMAYATGWAVTDSATATQLEEIDELLSIPKAQDQGQVTQIPEIDGFEIRFENGASGVFVNSRISEDVVTLFAQADGGWSTLEAEHAITSDLATSAVALSGVGGYTATQVERYLSGSVAGIAPYISESYEGFSGSSSTDDAEIMMQLLYLQVTEPQVDDVAFRSTIRSAHNYIQSAQIDPSQLSYGAYLGARYDDDPYHQLTPSAEVVDGLTGEGLLELYESRLGQVDDLVVAVAGDIDAQTVQELFITYVGTLPAGEPDTSVDRWNDPPTEVIELSVDAGDDAAGAGVNFYYTVQAETDKTDAIAVQMVSTILQARLFESIREDLGATYGGTVGAATNNVPDDIIETHIVVNGDPDRLDQISEAVLFEVADLAANGPTADEFARASAILSADYELVSNWDLLTMLIDLDVADTLDPVTRTDEYNLFLTLERTDVAAMAAVMFPDAQWIEIRREG